MLFSFQTLCLIPTFVPTCSIFLTLYLEVKKYEYYIYMTFTIHKQIRLMYFLLAFEMSYLVCTDSCVGELSQQCSIDGKTSLIILKTISDRKSRQHLSLLEIMVYVFVLPEVVLGSCNLLSFFSNSNPISTIRENKKVRKQEEPLQEPLNTCKYMHAHHHSFRFVLNTQM